MIEFWTSALRTAFSRTALVGAALLATAGMASAQPLAQPVTGQPAPAFSAKGIDGRPVSLAAYKGKVVVLEWTSPVCPFTTKKYARGVMQDLQRQARKDGFAWIAVNTSGRGLPGYLTPAQAKARIAAEHMTVSAFLLDDGRLGRKYGAKATPQVFIVGKDGALLFQGGVDSDAYAEEAPKAAAAVRAALSDIKAGRPVAVSDVRPYGCPVEYPTP